VAGTLLICQGSLTGLHVAWLHSPQPGCPPWRHCLQSNILHAFSHTRDLGIRQLSRTCVTCMPTPLLLLQCGNPCRWSCRCARSARCLGFCWPALPWPSAFCPCGQAPATTRQTPSHGRPFHRCSAAPPPAPPHSPRWWRTGEFG
jgi:hypothetical protein